MLIKTYVGNADNIIQIMKEVIHICFQSPNDVSLISLNYSKKLMMFKKLGINDMILQLIFCSSLSI